MYFLQLYTREAQLLQKDRSMVVVITNRHAQSAAMPVLFLLSGPNKIGFSSRRATRCLGVEMWEYSPQNSQHFKFWQRICSSGGHSFAQFLRNSDFVRVHRYILSF